MKVEIVCVIDGFYQTQWSRKWRVEALCLTIKLMILETWILQRDMDIEDGEIVKSNFIFSYYIFLWRKLIILDVWLKIYKTVKKSQNCKENMILSCLKLLCDWWNISKAINFINIILNLILSHQ